MDQQLKIRLDAIDNTLNSFKGLIGNIKKTKTETDKTTQSFLTLKNAVIAFATGTSARAILNQTKKFQDLQTILARVSGSLANGTQILNYLIDFTRKSTFSVEDLANSFITLSTAGIVPTERLLRVFTDTASASTDQLDTLNDLTRLFAKGVQGGLGLQTLAQLTSKGIPVFKILEEQLGLTKEGINDFAQTTKGANKILDALLTGLEKSFSGATEARAKNLSTAMSKLSKEFDLVLITIGQEGLTKAVSDLADAFSKLREEEAPLLQFFGSITTALTDAFTGFIMFSAKVAESLKRNIKEEIDSIKKAWQLMMQNFSDTKIKIQTETTTNGQPTPKITGKSTGLPQTKQPVEVVLDLQKVLNNVIRDNQNKIDAMNDSFSTTKGLTETITRGLNAGIAEFSQKLAESIVYGKQLTDVFRSIAQSLLTSILKQVIELIARETVAYFWKQLQTSELFKQLVLEKAITKEKEAQARAKSSSGGGSGDFVSTAFNVARAVFGFAEGGSVKAGQPITVGERGREVFMPKTDGTIIPHEKLGGSTNINFSITATDVRGVKELLIDNRATITNIVNQALNSRGKPALV